LEAKLEIGKVKNGKSKLACMVKTALDGQAHAWERVGTGISRGKRADSKLRALIWDQHHEPAPGGCAR
jgi:hypothetical protein